MTIGKGPNLRYERGTTKRISQYGRSQHMNDPHGHCRRVVEAQKKVTKIVAGLFFSLGIIAGAAFTVWVASW